MLSVTSSALPGEVSRPLQTINSMDQSGVVAILAAFSLGLVLISVPLRIYVRGKVIKYGISDFAYFGSVLVAVIQSSIVFFALSKGLGKADELLDPRNELPRLKATYAASILFVVALYLSKLSTAFFFLRLTHRRGHFYASSITIGLSTAWAVLSILFLAIRCNTPSPWMEISISKCSSLFMRYQAIAALDIITEIALFSISLYIVWALQMPKSAKAVVVCAFGFRLPTIAISALSLHYLSYPISNPPNLSLAYASAVACAQLQIGYSITVSIVPFLKHFMMAFETSHDPKFYVASYNNSGSTRKKPMGGVQMTRTSDEEELTSMRSPGTHPGSRDGNGNVIGNCMFGQEPVMYEAIIVGSPRNTESPVPGGGGGEKMIIKKGVEWSVAYDPSDGGVQVVPASPLAPEVALGDGRPF